MAAGARVTVVGRTLTPELGGPGRPGGDQVSPGRLHRGPGGGMALVMAATDDPSQRQGERRGPRPGPFGSTWRTTRSIGTFIVPAQVRRGRVDPGHQHRWGASPALARRCARVPAASRSGITGPYLDLLQRVRTRLLTERRAHPDNGPPLPPPGAQPPAEAVAQGGPGPGA